MLTTTPIGRKRLSYQELQRFREKFLQGSTRGMNSAQRNDRGGKSFGASISETAHDQERGAL
jgi:hypothetical protein